MATTRPDLAREVVGIDPAILIAGTDQELTWRCANHEETYQATGYSRVDGSGCPYCTNVRVLKGFNDMATTRPDLAAELVGTDPTTVFAQTNRVLLWRCPNHDEPYPTTGTNRANGQGCGYCHGLRVLPGFNDMATTRPDLAAELVSTDPTIVIAGTHTTLLWRCPNHDEPYPLPGALRAKGIGCSYCAHQRLLPGFNDMATTHPSMAADLVGTDPATVFAGTDKILLWRCPNHSEPYPARGSNRLKTQGCPSCAVYGFDPSKPAWIYLMQRHGEQQIGITGNLKIRAAYHARSGWVLVATVGPMRGGLAFEKELLIKQWLRQTVGTIAGTTETWSTASLEVCSLIELFGHVGIDG
jgi:hypothetical protein